MQRAGKWFEHHGKSTVFFCRFIPVIRSLISIPAGMARMNMGVFLLFTTMGTAIWNIVLVYLGAFFGASWGTVVEYMNTYALIVTIIFAALIVVFGILFYKKRIIKKKKAEETKETAEIKESNNDIMDPKS